MMTIGELAERTGIAASAIRYYEEKKLMRPPRRVSGRRVFDDDAVAELTVVQLAKDAGFTLAEIRQLVNDFPVSRWKRLAEKKLRDIEVASARLRMMTTLLEKLIKCQCFDLETCGRALRKRECADGAGHKGGRTAAITG
jgi:MerR family redox-sensitive transcriptional activator SoxR